MGIFRGFSRLLDALNSVAGATRDLASVQREAGPAIERLEALELHRAQFEAEMQGLLLKADGKMKAAANAEARERKMKESYDPDAFDPESEKGTEAARLLPDDVDGSEAARVPPVRVALATNSKAHAQRVKWMG